MSGSRFRRTTLCAVMMLSVGVLAASEASAAASRFTRREPSVSPWTRSLEGYFQGVHAKNGTHPPGQNPGSKPAGNDTSNSNPEGSGLCPFGKPNRTGKPPGGGN